jgi:hypothetical protein
MSRSKKTKKVFTKTDYNSGDGMLTTIWGPSLWHYLHIMSFNYPTHPTLEDKQHYKNFINTLPYVLPCKYCRMNLKNNFKKNPIKMCHMKNRHTFSFFIYNLHEIVNKMLKKKSNLTFCEVRDRYENFRSRCTNPTKSTIETENKVFDFIKEKNTNNTNNTKKNKKTKKEKGCTEPLYGKKAKCVINIVPQEQKINTFNIDKQCIKTRD